uniref:ubiquitinyl hydrolase 1 n=2 Tax=Schistocephalus solidus TaxID=70667 RepID=A0A0X3PL27_SCHSO
MSLRNYCLEKKYEPCLRKLAKTGGELFPALTSVLGKMQSQAGGTVPGPCIQKFKNVFAKVVPSYAGNMQQDALEFLTYLLDLLHEETKTCPQVFEHRRTTSVVQWPTAENIPQQNPSSPEHHPERSVEPKFSSTAEDSSILSELLEKAHSVAELGAKGTKRSAFRRLLHRVKRVSRSSSRTRQSKCVEPDPEGSGFLGSAEAAAQERSFLKETFVGHLQSRLRCCHCKNLTTRNELFWSLALCVPEEKGKETGTSPVEAPLKESEISPSEVKPPPSTGKPLTTKDHKVESDSRSRHISTVNSVVSDRSNTASTCSTPTFSLNDCLDAFTKVEVLDGNDRPTCERCKVPTKAKFQVLVSSLPEILVLQFLRFDSSSCHNKRRNLIDFGFELDLGPYTTKGLDERQRHHTREEVRPPCSTTTTIIARDKTYHRKLSCALDPPRLMPSRPNRYSTLVLPNLPFPDTVLRLPPHGDRMRRESHSSNNLHIDSNSTYVPPCPSTLTLTAESLNSLASIGEGTPCQKSFHENLDNARYRLYGVVYHRGGTERGHYTAKCLVRLPNSEEQSWYNFDDDNVSPITDLSEIVQSSAYILFYERIKEPQLSEDVDVNFHIESEESDTQSPLGHAKKLKSCPASLISPTLSPPACQ